MLHSIDAFKIAFKVALGSPGPLGVPWGYPRVPARPFGVGVQPPRVPASPPSPPPIVNQIDSQII